MEDKTATKIAKEIIYKLQEKDFTLATAESCTGGAIAATITSIAGCSSVYKGSVVAYCNEIKAAILGVNKPTLDKYGAVSEETVREMVCGVKKITDSCCAIATSGIAGPGGGSPEKPVGTVWMAISVNDTTETHLLQLNDEGRARNIENTTAHALSLLLKMLNKE